MRRIVFDIETVGGDFESLDEFSQEYFLKFADTPEKTAEARAGLSFYPVTAEVVAVSMLEVESGEGAVYFQNNNGPREKFQEEGVLYLSGSEEEILGKFWNQLKRYDQFVTFNGRCFDCPFLLTRSAIRQLRPTRNLMPYRYSSDIHVDLADQLTFYDAMRRRFPLHMWCRAFGVKSPKEDGVSGLQVGDLYRQGEYARIARYCLRDAAATKELFLYWENYLKF